MKKGIFSTLIKIKRVISTVFFILIIIYLSVVVLQRLSGNRSILGFRVFNVASESMYPVYKINDIIAVKDTNIDNLKVGQDVAYRGSEGSVKGKIITHRIIKIENNSGKVQITTKGISNDLSDPPIGQEQLMGKVLGKIPVINTLNHIIMTQAGFFFLIFCPIVIIISMEIAETIIDNKLDKEELIRIQK